MLCPSADFTVIVAGVAGPLPVVVTGNRQRAPLVAAVSVAAPRSSGPLVVAAVTLMLLPLATGGLLAGSVLLSLLAVRKVGSPTDAMYSTPSQPGNGVGMTWNCPGCSRSQRSSIDESSCWVL
ncbi:hypothetical protein N430_03598 [Pseudomonas sp. CC120222-01a]|nr:hypothetical protein N430_03598 [Pseudomonas sp. CC120222-01a]